MVEIKLNWKTILALGAVALFIFEILALGLLGGGGSGNTGPSGEIISGISEFSGVIRTYDPFLVVPSGLDEDTIEELREMEEVEDVTSSTEGMVIKTETRDDVYPIGVFLRERNITGITRANIAMPSFLEVQLGNGTWVNVSTGNFAASVPMEPIVDVDTEVTVKMVVYVADSMLYGYDVPSIVSEEKEIEVDSVVLSVDYIHEYIVPWKKRNRIDVEELSEEGEVEYMKRNTILFDQPLDINDVMLKKELYYITYIDQYSAECDENFTDDDQVGEDFGENITLPDSILTIVSDHTVELSYDGETVYSYALSLPEEADGITLGTNEIRLESEEFYEPDSEVRLRLTGTVIGDRMVAVKNVILIE